MKQDTATIHTTTLKIQKRVLSDVQSCEAEEDISWSDVTRDPWHTQIVTFEIVYKVTPKIFLFKFNSLKRLSQINYW